MKCSGCGLGWAKDCDNPGYLNFPYCGCGAVHNHDSLVKSTCQPLYWPDGALVSTEASRA